MSINKCELSVEFFWGFVGNFWFLRDFWNFLGKCAVSGVDFSPFAKAQNDSSSVDFSLRSK